MCMCMCIFPRASVFSFFFFFFVFCVCGVRDSRRFQGCLFELLLPLGHLLSRSCAHAARIRSKAVLLVAQRARPHFNRGGLIIYRGGRLWCTRERGHGWPNEEQEKSKDFLKMGKIGKIGKRMLGVEKKMRPRGPGGRTPQASSSIPPPVCLWYFN